MGDKALWEHQLQMNDMITESNKLLGQQIEFLLTVVKDHEKTIEMMADKMNELQQIIRELKES